MRERRSFSGLPWLRPASSVSSLSERTVAAAMAKRPMNKTSANVLRPGSEADASAEVKAEIAPLDHSGGAQAARH